MRGEQCRRASGPSRHAMCRRPAPPLQARAARGRCTAAPSDPAAGDRARRAGPRHRLHRRGGAGPRAVQRRVLAAGRRPVDAGPPRLHGSRPVQLHRVAPPLGHRRVGIGARPGRAVPGLRTAAYDVYAIVLGRAVPAWPPAAYARALGARGGRVVAIVLLLAVGIAGVVAGDRGLDFSLVWLPLELLVLTKARTNPAGCCPPPALCVAWVNTHGSILIGLLVLGVELGLVAGPGPAGRPHRRRAPVARTPVRWRWPCWASLAASCITPYGPGLLAYDVDVARNGQIAQYIGEWNSPDFHSSMVAARLLRAAGRPRRLLRDAAASRCSRAHWRRSSSWRRCGRSAWSST